MRTLVLAAFVLAWAVHVEAEIVQLKDGGRLEGAVLRRSGGELVLRTPQGVVHVSDDKIASVEGSPAPAPVPVYAPRRAWRRASADELFGPRRQLLTLTLGFTAPQSDVSFAPIGGGSASDGDVGPLFGVQYLSDVSPRLSLGGEFQFAGRSETDSPGLLPNSEARVFGSTSLFLGELKYALSQDRWARPYVLLGAGAARNETTIDARPNFGFVWSDTGTPERRRLVDADAWAAAATARLGVDFRPLEAEVFSLEMGWTGLSSADYPATAQGRALGLSMVSGPLSYLTFAGRFGWRF